MKNLKRFQIFVILRLLSAIGLILYHYFFEKFQNIIYLYILFVVIGFSFAYEMLFIVVSKQEKKYAYYENRMKLWNNISYRVKNAGETSFNEMPIGIIVFDDDFKIEWSNQYAQKIFLMRDLNNKSFDLLDTNFAEKIREREPLFITEIYGKVYRVEHMLRDHVLYLVDITTATEIENNQAIKLS